RIRRLAASAHPRPIGLLAAGLDSLEALPEFDELSILGTLLERFDHTALGTGELAAHTLRRHDTKARRIGKRDYGVSRMGSARQRNSRAERHDDSKKEPHLQQFRALRFRYSVVNRKQ